MTHVVRDLLLEGEMSDSRGRASHPTRRVRLLKLKAQSSELRAQSSKPKTRRVGASRAASQGVCARLRVASSGARLPCPRDPPDGARTRLTNAAAGHRPQRRHAAAARRMCAAYETSGSGGYEIRAHPVTPAGPRARGRAGLGRGVRPCCAGDPAFTAEAAVRTGGGASVRGWV